MKKEEIIIKKYYERVINLIDKDLKSEKPLLDLKKEFDKAYEEELYYPYLKGLTYEEVNSFFDKYERYETFTRECLLEMHGKIVTCYFGTF